MSGAQTLTQYKRLQTSTHRKQTHPNTNHSNQGLPTTTAYTINNNQATNHNQPYSPPCGEDYLKAVHKAIHYHPNPDSQQQYYNNSAAGPFTNQNQTVLEHGDATVNNTSQERNSKYNVLQRVNHKAHEHPNSNQEVNSHYEREKAAYDQALYNHAVHKYQLEMYNYQRQVEAIQQQLLQQQPFNSAGCIYNTNNPQTALHQPALYPPQVFIPIYNSLQ